MSLVTALEAPQSIASAIRKASRATGADFNYLLKTAARESAFNEGAKAKTSSAAGLFQFIESTWLQMVKDAGGKFGLDKYTPHIFTTRSGKYYVPNEKLRQEILELRHDPEVSAMMAGAFTRKNSEFISGELGREPSQGELYIAHFLGAKGAADLISRVKSRPNARADRHFPRAARANRSIFYARGRPRTLKQVYDVLVSDHAKLQASATAPVAGAVPAAGSQIVKPVAAAVKVAAPAAEQAPALVQTASLTQSGGGAKPDAILRESGVETKIIEPEPAKPAIGLAGQTGSPIAPPKKVAALTHNNLNIPADAGADAAAGSAGAWQTIIHSQAETGAQHQAPQTTAGRPADKTTQTDRRKTAKRTPRLLEQSAKRNHAPAATRTASAAHVRNSDFWERMSLYGN